MVIYDKLPGKYKRRTSSEVVTSVARTLPKSLELYLIVSKTG